MAQHYITQAERYLLAQIDGSYDIRYRDHYAMAVPHVARTLILDKGAADAIILLDQVMVSVHRRMARCRAPLTIYELQCYLDWIETIKHRIQSLEQQAADRKRTQPATIKEMVKAAMALVVRTSNNAKISFINQ